MKMNLRTRLHSAALRITPYLSHLALGHETKLLKKFEVYMNKFMCHCQLWIGMGVALVQLFFCFLVFHTCAGSTSCMIYHTKGSGDFLQFIGLFFYSLLIWVMILESFMRRAKELMKSFLCDRFITR